MEWTATDYKMAIEFNRDPEGLRELAVFLTELGNMATTYAVKNEDRILVLVISQ